MRGIAATIARDRCSRDGPAEAGAAKPIKAKVVRTKYGIPHITAKNIRSLAGGYAYAFAEDNLCTIANEYVTVSAERSKFFGPDENWYFSGNGTTYENIDADIYFQWVKQQGIVEDLMKQKAPIGPKRGVKRGVAGYVKGYNAYLKDTGVNNLPDERCRGAEWVRPIKKIDVYRRFYQLGILASSGAAIDGIAPPSRSTPAGRLNSRRTRTRCSRTAARSRSSSPDRLERVRVRQGGDRERPRPRLRQPALPLGRLRAPLPDPLQDPRQGRRGRRLALRRAAGADRPHARPRLVAHGRHRVALHPVQADLGRRPAHLCRRRRDEGHGGDRGHGQGLRRTAVGSTT